MDTESREENNEKLERRIKPANKLYFINDKLCRVIAVNRGLNIAYFFNLTDQKNQTMLLSDFKRHRKRAYTVKKAASLLDRTTMQIHRYIKSGMIKPPVGVLPGGERMFTQKSYYSEDDIFEIRNAMAAIHHGRPRKDGIIINNRVLTEKDLRAKMGDAITLYTRTEDGRFIPVWQEESY